MASEVTTQQKLFVLALLVLQNASVVIMTRYTLAIRNETYLASSVVVVVEIIKLIIASFCVYMNMGNSYLNTQPLRKLTQKSIKKCSCNINFFEILNSWPITKKLWHLIIHSGYSWVPAACYFLQNTLQYTALENLSAPVYAVLQQLKIFSAAIFSYIILSKKLSLREWRALALLVSGGVLIQYNTFKDKTSNNSGDPIKGSIAICTIIGLSGFAGVMTQLLLQNKDNTKQMSLWDRNVQFAFWSILIGFVSVFLDREYISNNGGFFGGWTFNTIIVVFLWTAGGILVAITIKYTDVIIKGFASAISLVCISILGYLLLGDNLDLIFCIGAFVVIIATFNYNDKQNNLINKQKSPIIEQTNENNNINNKNENNGIVIVNQNDIKDRSEVIPLTSNKSRD